MTVKPLIIAYYDGDSEVQCLSNFATAPFTLDGIQYKCVEGFWQSLKTEIPELRIKFSYLEGLDAKQAGRMVQRMSNSNVSSMFTYMQKLYVVGSEAHHILMERAIRAKVAQTPSVAKSLLKTGNTPLKHMLKSPYGTWKPGNSPALPALVFEKILTNIRTELANDSFNPDLPLPQGINELDP